MFPKSINGAAGLDPDREEATWICFCWTQNKMADRWVTWVRSSGTRQRPKQTVAFTRRASEGMPKGLGWVRRPATRSEIRAVRAGEERAREIATAQMEWAARSDVHDAALISTAIEVRLPEIIDRLTPAEWRTLANRLR